MYIIAQYVQLKTYNDGNILVRYTFITCEK